MTTKDPGVLGPSVEPRARRMTSLESATLAFDGDDVLRRALGEEFSTYFLTSRRWELQAWRETVTDWERERYDRSV